MMHGPAMTAAGYSLIWSATRPLMMSAFAIRALMIITTIATTAISIVTTTIHANVAIAAKELLATGIMAIS